MASALQGTPIENFVAPQPIVTGKPILDGEGYPSITILIDKTTGRVADASTLPSNIIEKTYRQLHDTLFYINKDNPRGPAPVDPNSEEQYEAWEQGVQDWARENGVFFEQPPQF